MNTERVISTKGRIQISMRQQGGVCEAILRVAGVDVIGGLSVTPIGAVQDMMRELKLVMHNDSEWLSKWPKPDYVPPVEPALERLDVPEPIFHRQQAIAAAVPMKPMRLGEVGAQLNRDAESYKKRRHATTPRSEKKNYGRADLRKRQIEMAERRHPNRAVVKAVRAAASASSN